MTGVIKEWLSSIYDEAYQRPQAIADVITDYFGEELVDAKLPDKESILEAIFGRFTVRDLVELYDVYYNQVTLRDMDSTIPEDKWIKDSDTPVLEVKDDFYLKAMHRRALRTLQIRIDCEPVEIIIRFPKVTVTNEFGRSIDITELYARVLLSSDGTMIDPFQMMRAEYTGAQYVSNYAHSHLPGACIEWMYPCLGSGPIANTQAYLRRNYDIERWGLFCYELSKYVTVESVSGGPYVRLESVGNTSGDLEIYPTPAASIGYYGSGIVYSFVRYFVRKQPFKVAFNNGVYALGEDPIDFLIRISRCFIEWYNRKYRLGIYTSSLQVLLGDGVLRRYVIIGKQLYRAGRRRIEDIHNVQNTHLFDFKGQEVCLNIIESDTLDGHNAITLLTSNIVSSIIADFLRVINYEYKEERTEENEGNSSTTNKRIAFL